MYMPRPPTLPKYYIPTGRSKKSPNNRERIGFILGLQEPLPFGLGFFLLTACRERIVGQSTTRTASTLRRYAVPAYMLALRRCAYTLLLPQPATWQAYLL